VLAEKRQPIATRSGARPGRNGSPFRAAVSDRKAANAAKAERACAFFFFARFSSVATKIGRQLRTTPLWGSPLGDPFRTRAAHPLAGWLAAPRRGVVRSWRTRDN